LLTLKVAEDDGAAAGAEETLSVPAKKSVEMQPLTPLLREFPRLPGMLRVEDVAEDAVVLAVAADLVAGGGKCAQKIKYQEDVYG
jgi:hypothetical protein